MSVTLQKQETKVVDEQKKSEILNNLLCENEREVQQTRQSLEEKDTIIDDLKIEGDLKTEELLKCKDELETCEDIIQNYHQHINNKNQQVLIMIFKKYIFTISPCPIE